jgi:hypothetical protein
MQVKSLLQEHLIPYSKILISFVTTHYKQEQTNLGIDATGFKSASFSQYYENRIAALLLLMLPTTLPREGKDICQKYNIC